MLRRAEVGTVRLVAWLKDGINVAVKDGKVHGHVLSTRVNGAQNGTLSADRIVLLDGCVKVVSLVPRQLRRLGLPALQTS